MSKELHDLIQSQPELMAEHRIFVIDVMREIYREREAAKRKRKAK